MLLNPIHLPDDLASSDEILEAIQNPLIVAARSGEVSYANPAALIRLDTRLIGRHLCDIFPDALLSPASIEGPVATQLVTQHGTAFHALVSPVAGGSICLSLWSASEVPALRTSSTGDELTGLLRRNDFNEALTAALGAPGEGIVAVHCLDLDRFKTINDTLGHGIGDELLKKVADRLRSACRKQDIIARLGGDEFAVIQPGIGGAEDAERLATRLVDLIGRTYVLGGHTINIGASVGVALQTPDLPGRDMLRNADLALYEAKRTGRGRYRMFESSMATFLQGRRQLEIDLRRALALRQFGLHYQPFIDVDTHEVAGFEALLRWRHPLRGNVPPLSFMPLAEENGLIVRIGEWGLSTACAQAASWPCELVVAVNVSPLQFQSGNLLEAVSSAIA